MRDDADPFIGCLDYIFCSPHVHVVGAPAMPHRSTANGPLPTSSEPSDHLLLSAELELPLTPDPALSHLYGGMDGAANSAAGGTEGRALGGGRSRQVAQKDGSERAAKAWGAEANEQMRVARKGELEAFAIRERDEVLDFPSSLNSYERKLVHSLAEELGLEHASFGEGRDRFIRVEKKLAQPGVAVAGGVA